MGSKLVAEHKDYLADLVVKAMLAVAEKQPTAYKADVDDVKVEKKTGESLTDTTLINGIVLDKEIVHCGMPKRVEKAKIALLDASLENEKPEIDAKINIETPDQIEAFLKQEETMLKNMVDKVLASGANVVICQKGIDDMAQHFMARKGCHRNPSRKKIRHGETRPCHRRQNHKQHRCPDRSRPRIRCLVEERKTGDDKMTYIEGCKNPKSVTILIQSAAPNA